MAGAVMMTPLPAAAAVADLGGAGSSSLSPAVVNSFRISTVADRLALHVGPTPKDDSFEFFNLCLSLARGIDYAVANNEVPDKVQDLPKLLKQVCQRKTLLLQAAIMVLMVSVKSACKTGWFSNEDSRELLTLADEVANNFISINDVNTDVSHSLEDISTVMVRFCPQLKMGEILSFLEVKPGYGTYLADFHIPKNVKPSAEEKARLFVVQTDNIETSSCLITPLQVNFLINGKGVGRRTNVSLETGPQIPSLITHMLKYGTNILQAVGQFNGTYIIAIAFMSVISSPDRHALQSYVRAEVTMQDQDSEIIEGPSRISLNCPISFQRIKTPVRGHSCKHLQCFDFDNFVDINSRRPLWRCPHCNQCVSYIDIRVDQSMAKILEEVGEGVGEVMISADGSWKAVMESGKNIAPSCREDMPAQQKDSTNSYAPLDVMDLTDGDYDMDVPGPIEIEDEKPTLADMSNYSGIENSTVPPVMDNLDVVNHNNGHIDGDFWSQVFLSTYPSEGSSPRSDSHIFGSVSSNLQLQQSQTGNSVVNNEYERDPLVTRPRVPLAVQALAVPSTTPVSQHSLRQNSIEAVTPQTPVTPSTADGSHTNYSTPVRNMQLSRSHLNSVQASQMTSPHFNPLQVSQMSGSSLRQQPTQNWHHQSHSFVSSQVALLNVPPSNPLQNTPRVAPHLNAELQNTRKHPIPPSNLRIPHIRGQPPNQIRSSTISPRNHIPQAATLSGISQNLSSEPQILSAQRATLPAMGRQHSIVTYSNQPNRASTSVTMTVDGIRALIGEQRVNMTDSSQPSVRTTDGSLTEQNWRPSSRMRGALQGQAYSAAMQQYIFQPTQPVQATRPPALPVPLPSLNVLLANSRNAHASQAVPVSEATGLTDSLDAVSDPTLATL